MNRLDLIVIEPPERKVEIVRVQIKMGDTCTSCREAPGHLACARCSAIKFCGKKCQKQEWRTHKGTCNKIKMLREETIAAGKKLADQYGGEEAFLRSPHVTRGMFRFLKVKGAAQREGRNPKEKYMLARQRLVEEYAQCGEESRSSMAYRLAAENMLDILCLTFDNPEGEYGAEERLYTYCSWMVNGCMDLQALKYLCYFRNRELSPEALPYLDLDPAGGDYIEDNTYLTILGPSSQGLRNWSLHWYHNYMLVALIKYRRMELLLVKRWSAEQEMQAFMLGTHQRAGSKSHVLMLRGKSPVIEKIKGLVMNQSFSLHGSLDERIRKLTETTEKMLSAVNERNPYLIPGLVDRTSIPPVPVQVYDEEDEFNEHGDDSHDAFRALENYGCAWNMSRSYTKVLQHFLNSGNDTIKSRKGIQKLLFEGVFESVFEN